MHEIAEHERSMRVSDTSDVYELALLRKWRESCKSMASGHKKSFEIYKWLDHACMGTGIMLSGCSGICTIVLTASLVTGPVIPIVAGVVSVLVGSIIALAKSGGFQEKMLLHNQSAADYAEIARDIQQEYTLRELGKSQYADVSEFIKQVGERIDRLEYTSLPEAC